LLLAAIIGGGFTCIAALFYRDNPEACGLVADGPLHNKALGSRRAPDAHLKQYTLAEVRRSYSFWIFAGSLSLFGLYITAMSFHAASIFESANVDRAAGYRIFLYAALLSITLRPFVGWLCDRIPLKILLLSMLAGILVSALGLRVLAPGLTFWIVVAGNGLCTATIGTLSTVTWPNFYGRLHLGAISGFNMAITVFASALGPWFFGSCYALFGSYDAAALVVVGLAGLLALLALRADNPQERVPAQSL